MKTKKSKPPKKNAKLSKIKCLRCGNTTWQHRIDAKYCSDLCRVQESNTRKELGFLKLAQKGDWQAIELCFKSPELIRGLMIGFAYLKEIEELDEMKKSIVEKVNTRVQHKHMLLYYLPLNKKWPYELYLHESLASRIRLSKFTVPNIRLDLNNKTMKPG